MTCVSIIQVRPVLDELLKEELAMKLYPGSVIHLGEEEVDLHPKPETLNPEP